MKHLTCGWCGGWANPGFIGTNTDNCGTITSVRAWHDGGSVGTSRCGSMSHGRDNACIIAAKITETRYQTCYQTCYYCDDSSYTLHGSSCSKPLTTTQPAAVHCQTN